MDEMTRTIIQGIEFDHITHEEAKGFVGHSLFLDIEYFNFLTDIPAEYMHSVCLGLIKRMIELTFKVGENRTRVTTRRLSQPSTYNKQMKSVKVPREFSRRIRNLDLSIIKAQEYRNMLLFFSRSLSTL